MSGMPAWLLAAEAAVTPGTISYGTPAASSAASSSAKRAKIAGSPPLSRTTVRPAPAWRNIASLISVCDIRRPWP